MDRHYEQSLEDDVSDEFRGATLRINAETINLNRDLSNYSEINMTDSARLQLSNSVDSQNNGNYLKNSQSNKETPAVSSGADVISPIASVSGNGASESVWNSNRNNDTVCVPTPHAFPIESPRHFFSFREGLLGNAIQEIIKIHLTPTGDTNVIGSWLLTEISSWDHERERLVVLTDTTLSTVKYDFIALRILDIKRILINKVDTVVFGKLVYPPASLVPRLGGLAEGVSGLVGDLSVFGASRCTSKSEPKLTKERTTLIDWNSFAPRDRNVNGIRLMWNGGRPLPFTTTWNPFSNEIPWCTYTSHPLYWHDIDNNDGLRKDMYSAEHFLYSIAEALKMPVPQVPHGNINIAAGRPTSETQVDNQRNEINELNQHNNTQIGCSSCKLVFQPIVLQNYIGLGALLHNINGLGFFKVRGKFSF